MFAAFVLCRSFHYGAAILLFGASVFAWGLSPTNLAQSLDRATWRLAEVAITTLIVTGLGWLLLQAGSTGDGWPDGLDRTTLGAVLFDTEFGRAWQVHGLLLLALSAAIALRRPATTVAVSGLELVSLGLVGHAAMQSGGAGWLHRASLGLHLLSAGVWLGGLVPLLAALRMASEPALRQAAGTALRRFSTLGHGAVAATVATGAINATLILGIGRFDPSSPYQALLGAKIALVGVMIGLALVNRYGVVPQLRRRPDATRTIFRNSVAELVLGGAVIAVVGLLGLLEPQP